MPGKNINTAALYVVLLMALMIMSACRMPEGADLPFAMPAIPGKNVVGSGALIKTACYIDAVRYNPLNVLDYTMEDGSQFFEFVVITAAQIKKDSHGMYIYLPDELRRLLEKHKTYIVPLQKKGVRVLLSVTGGGDAASFGNMTKDDITFFSRMIKETIDNYNLNGVEFYDNAAGNSEIKVYPPDIYTNEDDILDGWLRGGDCMNNIMYFTRQLFLLRSQEKIIMLREKNFGRYLPPDVSGSEGEATFSGTAQQINFFINPDFGTFKEESAENDNEAYFIYRNQYAPMLINLGDEETGPVLPPVYNADGNDITGFTKRFYMEGACDYGLLCYYNLKSAQEAASGAYLADNRPGAAPGTHLTQAEYISLTTKVVLGKDVICSGGDYRMDW
ncbi:MAG: hypothetical protein LBU18_07885 [Treponema sp.]|jgi:hypothetical protein|nr:hypothetical protein [Treponema sp.]